MPLVRFQVRNEYALGQPELYKETDVEDPKAVLDGVAVAGLVGILRQLGDLAEFAAEVFHGLQEQLTTTASRSQKLKFRVQNIEAALPPIEKAILAQNSHIHFAYTAGSEWHPRIQNEQNHFIYNDLPRFIMDSYEECRDPPRLHILDKFDTGGPGSCLKRYSDPTFFRRASGGFKELDAEKVQRDKKARKVKKKRSIRRKGSSLQNGSISSHSERSQFFQPTVNGRTSSSHTDSTIDLTLKSDLGDRSNSVDSGNGSNHIECVFRPSSSAQPEEQKSSSSAQPEEQKSSSSAQPEEQKSNGFSSRSFQGDDSRDSGFSEEQSRVADDNFLHCSSPKQLHHRSPGITWVGKKEREEPGVADDSFLHGSSPELIPLSSSCGVWDEKAEGEQPEVAGKSFQCGSSPEQLLPSFSSVTWDEKEEISEAESQHFDRDEAPDVLTVDSAVEMRESGAITEIHNPNDVWVEDDNVPGPSSTVVPLDDVESETDNFMDALNTIDSESENELDYQTKHEVKQIECSIDEGRTDDGHNEVSAGTSGQANHEVEQIECSIDEGRTDVGHNEVSAGTSGQANHEVEQIECSIDEGRTDVGHNEVSAGTSGRTYHEAKQIECAIDDGRTDVGHNEVSAGTSGRTYHEAKQIECAIDDGRTEDGLNEVSAATSGHHPQYDSYVLPDISSDHGITTDVLLPVPLVIPAKEQTPDDSEESSASASDSELGILTSTTADAPGASEVESPVLDWPSVIVVKEEPLADIILKDSEKPRESSVTEFSQVEGPSMIAVKEAEEPLTDIVLNDSIKPQESSVTEFFNVEPIKLWTNGGLLGLQPSKPPDFNVSNAASQGSQTNTAEVVNSPMPSNNCDNSERPSGSGSSESWHDDNAAIAKDASNSNYRSRFHPHGGGLNTPGNGLPLGTYIKFTTSGGASHETDGHPSQKIFGLGQRLLANGFARNITLPPSSESELSKSSPQLAESEKKGRQPMVKFQASQPNDLDIRFGHKSSDYLTSSPPLEHMKLSFQPTDGVEASKLQLKFPDGNFCNESSTDMFPSFQLVPDSATGRNDAISDSDDDTFCRSSPYLSDDCLSHHSDSDSDQWEAGQSPERVHNSDDDASCSIPFPSMESFTAPMKLGEIETNRLTERADGDAVSSCLSTSVLDLPSFDSVKPPLEEVRHEDQSPPLKLQQLKSSSPLPPPLPPAQWWLSSESKPTSDIVQSKPQDAATPQIAFIPKFLVPPTSQQPKPAPATEQQAHPAIVPFTPKRKNEPKLNWQKEANPYPPANGKVTHEQEDFLHQIRSKSFSLRPTAPSKMNLGGTTTVDTVTEILKKANAIRQVVASDVDDDDDAWSDP
ncbi:Protein SCAR1 [Linum perenne]